MVFSKYLNCRKLNNVTNQKTNLFHKFKILLSTVLICLLCSPTDIASDEGYVGSTKCANCHEEQYQAWKGSHHDMAMRHASPESIRANFNNQALTFKGETNLFFKKGAEYWVNIKGPDGDFHDYRIRYTIGYETLKQYMA